MRDTVENELRSALAWLAEMSGYAINHLEEDWARKNRADLQSALDEANNALARSATLLGTRT